MHYFVQVFRHSLYLPFASGEQKFTTAIYINGLCFSICHRFQNWCQYVGSIFSIIFSEVT